MSYGLIDMLLNSLIVRRRWKTVVHSKTTSMNRVKTEYQMYSSRSHKRPQKTWKTKNGATACSLKSSTKVGTGMSNTFLPKSVRARSMSWVVVRPLEVWKVESAGVASQGYEMRAKVLVAESKRYLSRWYEKKTRSSWPLRCAWT